ncbi:hypothetical protein ACFL0J_08465 [Candidatus Neomarinimicrobiota bacterium]
MKNTLNMVIALIIISLFALIISCSEGILPTENTYIQNTEQALAKYGDPCESTVSILNADQDIPVGNVTVSNDETNLYVTYNVDAPWVLMGTHLSVAITPDDIPQNKAKNPKIGKFEYGEGGLASLATVTYTIPLTDFDGVDCEVENDDLFIAAHAKVQRPIPEAIEEPYFLTESAWGFGLQFNEKKSWASYFTYEWCCLEILP